MPLLTDFLKQAIYEYTLVYLFLNELLIFKTVPF